MRNYVRKTFIKSWDDSTLTSALKDIKTNQLSILKASKKYQIPFSTLRQNWKKIEDLDLLESERLVKLGRFRPVFTEEQEQELINYILEMDEKFFGLTRNELRQIAFQYAESLKIPHNFNKIKGLAGEDWYLSFMARHPQLSLRNPENTSFARATGFNKVVVEKFFNLLSSLMNEFNFSPENIWNEDETGTSVVPKKQPKVISLKGKKQVGIMTSAERGTTVTAAIRCNAAGNYLPLLIIYPRVRYNAKYEKDSPPGSSIVCHPSGWMQSDIFYPIWFNHFIKHAKPSKENPVLLILDGHVIHTKNLEFLLAAQEHNVHILCIPPHTSHKLQPLDRSFMKPYSSYHAEICLKWLRAHPGQVLTLDNIPFIFGNSFLQAATPINAINGFKITGIYPLNPDIFEEKEFSPASTTNIEISSDKPEVNNNTENMNLQESISNTEEGRTDLVVTEGEVLCRENTVCRERIDEIKIEMDVMKSEIKYLKSLVLEKNASIPASLENISMDLENNNQSDDPQEMKCMVHNLNASTLASTSASSENNSMDFNIDIVEHLQEIKHVTQELNTSTSYSPTENMSNKLNSSIQQASQKQDLKRILGEIMPIPKAQYEGKVRRHSRNKGETVILTSSDYIEKLKNSKISKKVNTKSKEKKCKKEKSIKQKKSNKKKMILENEDTENLDAPCLICASLFSNSVPGEKWIQCQVCKGWSHERCVLLPKKNISFTCEDCATT